MVVVSYRVSRKYTLNKYSTYIIKFSTLPADMSSAGLAVAGLQFGGVGGLGRVGEEIDEDTDEGLVEVAPADCEASCFKSALILSSRNQYIIPWSVS